MWFSDTRTSLLCCFLKIKGRITGNPRHNANNKKTRKIACLRAGQSRPWVAKPLLVEPGQMRCSTHQSSSAGALSKRVLKLKRSSPYLNSLKHWNWDKKLRLSVFSQQVRPHILEAAIFFRQSACLTSAQHSATARWHAWKWWLREAASKIQTSTQSSLSEGWTPGTFRQETTVVT